MVRKAPLFILSENSDLEPVSLCVIIEIYTWLLNFIRELHFDVSAKKQDKYFLLIKQH